MKTNEFAHFAVGAAVGVAAAVLFTPKSGAEIRKILRSKASDGTDFAASCAADVRGAASDAIVRGKKVVRQQAENLSAAVEAGVETFRETVQATP